MYHEHSGSTLMGAQNSYTLQSLQFTSKDKQDKPFLELLHEEEKSYHLF